MGCDGGTIPKRDELVKTKKKKEIGAKDCVTAARWNYCHLSQLPLQKPIVTDRLGNLYNKESIIEYLLDKTKFENGPDFIKTLKDVKELELQKNPNLSKDVVAEAETSSLNKAQWICPITGLEINGMFKFYCIFSCGCVFSERAYKGVNNLNLKCLKCDRPYEDNDLIILNPNEEDLKTNERKIETRKDLKKLEKKKNSASVSGFSSATLLQNAASLIVSPTKTETIQQSEKSKNEKTAKVSDGCSKINNDSSSKRCLESSSTKTKKIKSIQDDPNASEVFKSLFTSSSKAKGQQKAHWVTYNPQYF